MVDWQIFAAGTFFFMLTIGLFIVKTIAEKLFGAKIPTFIVYIPLVVSGILMLDAFGFFNWLKYYMTYGALIINPVEIVVGFILLLVSIYSKSLTQRIRIPTLVLSLLLILDGTRTLPILSGLAIMFQKIATYIGIYTLKHPIEGIILIIVLILLITVLAIFSMWLINWLVGKLKGGVKA